MTAERSKETKMQLRALTSIFVLSFCAALGHVANAWADSPLDQLKAQQKSELDDQEQQLKRSIEQRERLRPTEALVKKNILAAYKELVAKGIEFDDMDYFLEKQDQHERNDAFFRGRAFITERLDGTKFIKMAIGSEAGTLTYWAFAPKGLGKYLSYYLSSNFDDCGVSLKRTFTVYDAPPDPYRGSPTHAEHVLGTWSCNRIRESDLFGQLVDALAQDIAWEFKHNP